MTDDPREYDPTKRRFVLSERASASPRRPPAGWTSGSFPFVYSTAAAGEWPIDALDVLNETPAPDADIAERQRMLAAFLAPMFPLHSIDWALDGLDVIAAEADMSHAELLRPLRARDILEIAPPVAADSAPRNRAERRLEKRKRR